MKSVTLHPRDILPKDGLVTKIRKLEPKEIPKNLQELPYFERESVQAGDRVIFYPENGIYYEVAFLKELA